MKDKIVPIERIDTRSIKWDFSQQYAGYQKLLPLWVADMDFASPTAISEAIKKRTEHPVYGYTDRDDYYYSALVNWLKRRHQWQIDEKMIRFSPGVIAALNGAVQAFSDVGDKVIIQTPVYYPFITAVTNNNRQLAINQLKEEDGNYSIDFDNLRQLIDKKTKMLILCNPHNPVGRVWTKEELETLGEICLENKIVVVADEIHGDITFKPHKYIPFATVKEGVEELTLTCTSPSKTFNIAGLQCSNIIFQNPELFEKFDKKMFANGLYLSNPFSIEATIAAYNSCETWLDNLLQYLWDNYKLLQDYCAEHLPSIKVSPLEGTYLGWMDFRNYGFKEELVEKKLMEDAGVWLEKGSVFGVGGDGFQRINLGTGRENIQKALEAIHRVFS